MGSKPTKCEYTYRSKKIKGRKTLTYQGRAGVAWSRGSGVGERSTNVGRILARENPKDREAATFAATELVKHIGLIRSIDHLLDLASEVVPPD